MAHRGMDHDQASWDRNYYGRPVPTWGSRYGPDPGIQAGYNDRYDRAYGYDGGYGRGSGRPYDRYYKSQWQTDRGDPYGDRARGTPMRVTRGPYPGPDRYANGWWGSDPGYGAYNHQRRYDRGWMW